LRTNGANRAAASARPPVSSSKNSPTCCHLRCTSSPPVGRQLTLVASDITVWILDGSFEIARHARTCDRHQLVLDPASGGGAKGQTQSIPLHTRRPTRGSRAGE
jgi:hypothetical protein